MSYGGQYPMSDRMLLLGDNLDLLKKLPDSSVDLVYGDPPFNSNKDYSAIFKSQAGDAPSAQIEAFEDTWKWGSDTVHAYQQAVTTLPPAVVTALEGFRRLLTDSSGKGTPLLAYLVNMAIRLHEMRRVMKPEAQIYIHCDPTAGHYLKILMDAIFGPKNFLNEIVWYYKTSSGSPNYWLHRNHDTIFRYSNGDIENMTWNHPREPWPEETLVKWQRDEDGRVYRVQNKFGKRYYIDERGKLEDDVWEYTFASRTGERLGYPTQKPEWLLEKIIRASSNPGQVVLDPFMGGGTTVIAAERLGRKWIGMDLASVALNLTRRRLAKPPLSVDLTGIYVNGWPTTIEEAKALAGESEYNFQVWVCDMLDAAPNKRGADGGIDGRLFFFENQMSTDVKLGIVSVKSGKVGVKDIRELANRVAANNAEVGVFVTLQKPTQPMLTEAAQEGTFTTLFGEHDKIQILTIEDLFAGKLPDYPSPLNVTYKQVKGMAAPTPPAKKNGKKRSGQMTLMKD